MAEIREKEPEVQEAPAYDPKAESRQLRDEKRKFKREQKQQKKEAKKRAKEISEAEDRLEEEGVMTGGVPVFLLPGQSTMTGSESSEMYGGYTNLKDAVDQIRSLELQLEAAQSSSSQNVDTISSLQAEVDRLRTFEAQQTEFERIKNEFYNEVVYSDKGPGIDAYRKYYESIDPVNAEYLYKQVVEQEETDAELQAYVKAYSGMKAKAAAEIFEELIDNQGSIELVARILGAMGSDARGDILAAMDPVPAARVTKLMDPGY